MAITEAVILADLKKHLKEHQIELDFRVHRYLENQYGLMPCVDYDFAANAIDAIYGYFEKIAGKRWIWNKQMEIEKLRTGTIKQLCQKLAQEAMIYLANSETPPKSLKPHGNVGKSGNAGKKRENVVSGAFLSFPITADEKKLIQAKARDAGMSTSEFIRVILKKEL